MSARKLHTSSEVSSVIVAVPFIPVAEVEAADEVPGSACVDAPLSARELRYDRQEISLSFECSSLTSTGRHSGSSCCGIKYERQNLIRSHVQYSLKGSRLSLSVPGNSVAS
jgi:hypothetical protein